ncbi:MAG: hypothetical protein AAGI45_20480 [Cyanobacteria bacterium P01_H01_bin.26]
MAHIPEDSDKVKPTKYKRVVLSGGVLGTLQITDNMVTPLSRGIKDYCRVKGLTSGQKMAIVVALIMHRGTIFLGSIWTHKWVGKPIGYLLSPDEREEWLGDLLEIKDRMKNEDNYPVWVINLIIVGKTVCLIGSKLSITIGGAMGKIIE